MRKLVIASLLSVLLLPYHVNGKNEKKSEKSRSHSHCSMYETRVSITCKCASSHLLSKCAFKWRWTVNYRNSELKTIDILPLNSPSGIYLGDIDKDTLAPAVPTFEVGIKKRSPILMTYKANLSGPLRGQFARINHRSGDIIIDIEDKKKVYYELNVPVCFYKITDPNQSAKIVCVGAAGGKKIGGALTKNAVELFQGSAIIRVFTNVDACNQLGYNIELWIPSSLTKGPGPALDEWGTGGPFLSKKVVRRKSCDDKDISIVELSVATFKTD